MSIKSILKPEGSILVGGVTVITVVAIYGKSLPDTATMHATQANDRNLDSARKKATLTSIGIMGAISLLTRDVNVFILGGLTVVALDFQARHANVTSPTTGELVSDGGYGAQLSVVPNAS